MKKSKLLIPTIVIAGAASLAPAIVLSSCDPNKGATETIQCYGSDTYDGYIPNACKTGQFIKLKKNTSYKFVISSSSWKQNLFASLFSLITKWDVTKPEYYDLQLSEIVSVKHNNTEEKSKIQKEDEYFILNNDEGYKDGEVAITIKLSKDVECMPNIQDA